MDFKAAQHPPATQPYNDHTSTNRPLKNIRLHISYQVHCNYLAQLHFQLMRITIGYHLLQSQMSTTIGYHLFDQKMSVR